MLKMPHERYQVDLFTYHQNINNKLFARRFIRRRIPATIH